VRSGYNAINRSCDPKDDHYHGTHVSGTIAATGNNGIGVSGVNWTTRIMGLKFLDSSGSGSTSNAIDAIEFAIQVKARFAGAPTPVNVRVLSNSWGGDGFAQALLDEINKANTNDMLFVAAAGNSGANIDSAPQYPASFSAPNMISVAATSIDDSLASFSNWGQARVHLGAPGVNIISTIPGGGYGNLSGTSMAAPHVAGAAMLLLSKCALTTSELKGTLLANVDAIAAASTSNARFELAPGSDLVSQRGRSG
jgi:subtilisin family serine protease